MRRLLASFVLVLGSGLLWAARAPADFVLYVSTPNMAGSTISKVDSSGNVTPSSPLG